LVCSDLVEFGDGWSEIAYLESSMMDCELTSFNNGNDLVVDNSGRVHIVYRRRRKLSNGMGGWELAYRRLSPVGEGMKPDKNVVVVADTVPNGNPCIATDGVDRVLLAWEGQQQGSLHVFTLLSSDGGATWSGTRYYWSATVDGCVPAADFDSRGRLHLTWGVPGNITGRSTRYLRTDASVSSCEKETLIHYVSYGHGQGQSSIVVDDSDCVHIGWPYMRISWDYRIDYARSANCGDSWTSVPIIDGTGECSDPAAAIEVDGQGRVFVFWNGIRLRRSIDRGVSWDSVTGLTQGGSATVAVGPQGNLHVVAEKDGAIWYVMSADHGTSWSEPYRLSKQTVSTVKSPDVAVGPDGLIHVVWQQYDDDNGVNRLCYRVGR